MKNIGILGFGVVGKSVIKFLQKNGDVARYFNDDALALAVWDAKKLSSDDLAACRASGVQMFSPDEMDLKNFIASKEYIVTSPGFDLSAYDLADTAKLCELDLFSNYFTKQTIGITGAFGKTTATKLLTMLINKLSFVHQDYVTAVQGGNVGVGMLDLLEQQNNFDVAVLELSSFQLERSKTFAPDVALLMNLHQNHLDRHKTMQAYVDAKFKLFAYQHGGQNAIMPADMMHYDQALGLTSKLQAIKSTLYFVGTTGVAEPLAVTLDVPFFNVLDVQDGKVRLSHVVHQKVRAQEVLFDVSLLSELTFLDNWLMIIAALYAYGVKEFSLRNVLTTMQKMPLTLEDYHHRLERFATYNEIDFYNDSKSTVIQTTQAAVKKLAANNRPIIVILGGLSKGIDRSALQKSLDATSPVKKIYCFGPECAPFTSAQQCATLEDIINDIFAIMQPGDQILLSPSGASFDAFKNYEHRGNVFKELVLKRIASLQ